MSEQLHLIMKTSVDPDWTGTNMKHVLESNWLLTERQAAESNQQAPYHQSHPWPPAEVAA